MSFSSFRVQWKRVCPVLINRCVDLLTSAAWRRRVTLLKSVLKATGCPSDFNLHRIYSLFSFLMFCSWTITPSPPPQVQLWLTKGCGQSVNIYRDTPVPGQNTLTWSRIILGLNVNCCWCLQTAMLISSPNIRTLVTLVQAQSQHYPQCWHSCFILKSQIGNKLTLMSQISLCYGIVNIISKLSRFSKTR